MDKSNLIPEPMTKPYWEALARGVLSVQRCKSCGHRQHYPRPFCLNCLSVDVVLEPCTAKPTLYAFTINHTHSNPAFKTAVPFVMALVEVEDGIRMMARLIDIDPTPEAVKIGILLEPVSFAGPDGTPVPAFRPVSG
jgi:uncharacterized OB-fold protein